MKNIRNITVVFAMGIYSVVRICIIFCLTLISLSCQTAQIKEVRIPIEGMQNLKPMGFDCFITDVNHGSQWCEKLGNKYSCCLVDENAVK